MENNIGSFRPSSRFFLAPMVTINDISFRLLCKKAGAGLTYTGMINPLSLEKFDLSDKPGLQLFSAFDRGIKEFIEKYESNVNLFDFNFGCPAKTAKEHGFGCFLSDLGMVKKILKTMRDATEKPLTIKLRKSKNTLKMVRLANKYCDGICIHPRTVEQGYGGVPDLEFAKKIKNSTSLPVIYSGNVNLKNSEELLDDFNFLMVGRTAMGNPSIFLDLCKKKSRRIIFRDYLKIALKRDLFFSQIKLQAMNFTQGLNNASKMRASLVYAKNVNEIKSIMETKEKV